MDFIKAILQAIWEGFTAFFISLKDSLPSLFKTYQDLKIFESPYSMITYIVESQGLTGINWLDKVLFFVASVIPTLVVALLSVKLKFDGRLKIGISIVVYLLTIYLFPNWIFWVVIGGILLATISYIIILYIRNLKNKD